MHATIVMMKDGKRYSGFIWEWRPLDGYFTITDSTVSDSPIRIDFSDVQNAKTTGQRISINSPPDGEDRDELIRAKQDGWSGI